MDRNLEITTGKWLGCFED
jgi:hypothetical protein